MENGKLLAQVCSAAFSDELGCLNWWEYTNFKMHKGLKNCEKNNNIKYSRIAKLDCFGKREQKMESD